MMLCSRTIGRQSSTLLEKMNRMLIESFNMMIQSKIQKYTLNIHHYMLTSIFTKHHREESYLTQRKRKN